MFLKHGRWLCNESIFQLIVGPRLCDELRPLLKDVLFFCHAIDLSTFWGCPIASHERDKVNYYCLALERLECLPRDHGSKQSLAACQFTERALIDNASLIQDVNLISILNRA